MTRARRVFMLTSCLGHGGAERVTVNIANYLNQRGWSVTILPFRPEIDDYPVDDGIVVDRGMPQGGLPVLRGLQKQRHIMAAIRRAAPDVVVSLAAGLEHLALSRALQRYQLVTSVVTDPAWMFEVNPVTKALYRLGLRLSSRIVFQSRGALSYFGEDIQRKGEIIDNPLVDGLVHNGTPFSQRDQEIVTFGRLIPVKRLDVLLRAFAIFRRDHPEYRLTIFGRGPERERLMRLADDLGLSAHVTIEDFRTDIHDRIRTSAMYVSSSDIEGVSNSMLEAMALGLPSACTDAAPGGTREIIGRFGTGALARVGDPESLASAMREIAGSPERADEMIERGRKLSDELANDVVCAQWTRVFESAIVDDARGEKQGRP